MAAFVWSMVVVVVLDWLKMCMIGVSQGSGAKGLSPPRPQPTAVVLSSACGPAKPLASEDECAHGCQVASHAAQAPRTSHLPPQLSDGDDRAAAGLAIALQTLAIGAA